MQRLYPRIQFTDRPIFNYGTGSIVWSRETVVYEDGYHRPDILRGSDVLENFRGVHGRIRSRHEAVIG